MTLEREGEVEAEPRLGECLLVAVDDGGAWGSVAGGGGGVDSDGVTKMSDAIRDEHWMMSYSPGYTCTAYSHIHQNTL